MAVDEANVATAALAIAISALVISCGQFISQLFSTADDYRRCQPSVIGDWFKLVELPFRWSSFRFEVKVTTPLFEINAISSDPSFEVLSLVYGTQMNMIAVPLLGTKSSRKGTFCKVISHWPHARRFRGEDLEDTVSWLTLLDDIHNLQYCVLRMHDIRRIDGSPVFPSVISEAVPGTILDKSIDQSILHRMYVVTVRRTTRSWDFMPPDIVRPVASTTVGCLISMAYRMNMVFLDFQLGEGKIRASGNGRGFSTSLVRGMGLVVEYSTDGSAFPKFGDSNVAAFNMGLRVPSYEAEMMAFGIIPKPSISLSLKEPSPRYTPLSVREFGLPIISQLAGATSFFGVEDATLKVLEESLLHQSSSQRLPGFRDILGLWSDWLPLPGSSINTVDNPFPIPVTSMGEVTESRVVWRWLLRQQESSLSDQRKRVLQLYDNWEKSEPQLFYEYYRVLGNYTQDLKMMSFFKEIFDETTSYFESLDMKVYAHLVASHTDLNAHSLKQAEKNIEEHKHRQDLMPNSFYSGPYKGDSIFTERAFIYVDNISTIADKLSKTNWLPRIEPSDIEDAWWMLMLRLHAWSMGIRVVTREGVHIPSKYYNDPARVYIL